MLNILLNLFSVSLLVFVLLGAYIAIEAFYYQGHVGAKLQKELGFREGTTYNRNSRRLESAVAIVEVDEGGVFHHAGFRPGDALPRESHTSLFKRLYWSRTRAVEFSVVDSGDGPPFCKRPVRTLCLVVPAKQRQA